ncbi:MAG: CocE/NonD family hydrolase [Pseudomonadota bacterium]
MSNELLKVKECPDVGIIMTDGTRLSGRLWRPETDEAVPLILEYLPYRKRDGTCARDALTHPWFAARGYACLRVDIRGNGDSHGLMDDEYTQQELDDAVEVIKWAAAQDWCNGSVGMMGISWGGFNALQVAAMAPAPLKAIITLCSTVDRFADDIHYKGGCLLNENLGWGATMWAYSSRPPDPALRDDWREMWLKRLQHEPFLPATWLRHQRRDAYWRHGSVCEDYGAIKAKVLAVGGWGDAYKNAVPQVVENIPGSKGIVGPWVHKYPHFAVPEPRIGFLQEAVRWWDRWLKGAMNGAEKDPDYRPYLMDGVRPATWYEERDGDWLADPGVEPLRLHLSDNALSVVGEAFCTVAASPQQCGVAGGEYCAIWLGPEMPGDQRPDDAMSACFDSGPLTEDLAIAGAPDVTLQITCDQPQAQIAVRLCHVHPDGASTRVTYGTLNLSHRNGSADPKASEPNVSQTVTLALDHIAYRVPAGHRLRLAVSTSYWPLVWPAPSAATITLTGGSVDIPQVKQSGVCSFPLAESAEPWKVNELRAPAHIRRTETDHRTGTVTLIIEDDFGKVQDLDHGLISGAVARENWSIHPDDPLSAKGFCHWTEEVERDGIRMRTETTSEMTSDADNFYLRARLEAFENDKSIFSKEISETVERDYI